MSTPTSTPGHSLDALHTSLTAERDALVKQAAPLHAKADAIRAKMAPLEAELREVTQQIRAIEQPRLRDVSMDLARISRGKGGRRLVNDGPAPQA